MPVKHIKKAVGQLTQGGDSMRLVGIAVVVIAVIAIGLWLAQGAAGPAPTPTPVATPTPEVMVKETPTPVGTPVPSVYVPPASGQVTEQAHCTDGTPEGQCNAVSGRYCRQAPLGLDSDCTKCGALPNNGCPSGTTCDAENKACRS